jgi:hypothetical protein
MKAPIAIGVSLCVAAGVLFLLFAEDNPDASPAAPYLETAVSRVRATMRDNDAKIENVVFHPVPGPGPIGRSYACGYARSSTATNARSERFIYHFGPDTVSFIEQLRDGDHRANAVSLCNLAPLPLESFDLSDDRNSLKTNR